MVEPLHPLHGENTWPLHAGFVSLAAGWDAQQVLPSLWLAGLSKFHTKCFSESGDESQAVSAG